MYRTTPLAALALGLSACWPFGPTVSSSKGRQFTVRDVVISARSDTGGIVIVSEAGNTCELLSQRTDPPSSLLFTLRTKAGLLAPGDYIVQDDDDARRGLSPPSPSWVWVFLTSPSGNGRGHAGRVHLDRVEKDSIAGNFDVTLIGADAETLTGWFDARPCPQ